MWRWWSYRYRSLACGSHEGAVDDIQPVSVEGLRVRPHRHAHWSAVGRFDELAGVIVFLVELLHHRDGQVAEAADAVIGENRPCERIPGEEVAALHECDVGRHDLIDERSRGRDVPLLEPVVERKIDRNEVARV